MKSVTLSEVIREHDSYRFLCPIQSWAQFKTFALTLTFGLPAIAILFMLVDPGAPAAYVVVPVLVGGLTPVFAALPARFDVITRFDAQHFTRTLDEAMCEMGYQLRDGAAGVTRCYTKQAGLLRWKENEIAVTVREHSIAIAGPVLAMHTLQHKLSV